MSSVLFNPWDRALYLSVKHKRPFLASSNWRSPFQGWLQSALHRTFSGGLYFVLQGLLSDALPSPLLPSHSFLIGLLAGSLNGALLNPLAAIKYHNWGSSRSWSASIQHAMDRAGYSVFFKGMVSTMTRDSIFGVSYEVGRRNIAHMLQAGERHDLLFVANMSAAMAATVLSAPFNYVRTIQYAHIAEKERRPMWNQMLRLWANAKLEPSPLRYLGQRLRIGWGTMRVAVGMAVAQLLFAKIKERRQ